MLHLLLAAPVLANGQTSHQWITVEAVGEAELAGFLEAYDVEEALLNGTMFPDGGYAVGDGYGEMAHWEPLQVAYLDWIVATYDAPWTDEGAAHVAFLLGMASHGLADQLYDSTYMERSKAYDPAESWAEHSMDEATDVAFAAEAGPGEVPAPFIPYDPLLTLFADQGHAVGADTLDEGQSLLGIVIAYVGMASDVDESVAMYAERFPWACAHQTDAAVPGNPPAEATLVARYWEHLWARLAGEAAWTEPVLGLVAGARYEHPRGAASVESRVGVVFSRGLDPATVTTDTITVTDERGAAHPVTVDVFYGYASHVVNVSPVEDWAAGTDYTVTIHPGVATFQGDVVAEPVALTFSTKAAPVPAETPEPTAEAPAEASRACGCGSAPGATAALLGAALSALARVRRRGTPEIPCPSGRSSPTRP